MAIEKLAYELDGDMYGITFDLDTNMLERDYSLSRPKAYGEIERVLLDIGFTHIQYSVYFCKETTAQHLLSLKWLKLLHRLILLLQFEICRVFVLRAGPT